MTRDEYTQGNEPGGSRPDPVADFFASEREAIQPAPAGEDSWQAIARRAQSDTRHRQGRVLASAAAAAVVVASVGVAVATRGSGGDTSAVLGSTAVPSAAVAEQQRSVEAAPISPPTVAASTTVPVTSSMPQGPPASTTAPQNPSVSPELRGYRITSVTSTGTGRLVALANHPQEVGEPLLLESATGGRSWKRTVGIPNVRNAIGVRFATPTTGYLYGEGLWRTTNGGTGWSKITTPASTIVSLEVKGDTAWFVDDQLRTWRYSAGRVDRVMTGTASPDPATTTGWIAMDGTRAYLNLRSKKTNNPGATAVRLDGTPHAIDRPNGCGTAGDLAVAPAANAPGHWLALCANASGTGLAAAWSSGEDVASATPATGLPSNLTLPAISLTALDSRAAVVAVPVSPGSTTARLLRTADGGATWTPSDAPRANWLWVGAAGGQVVYAEHANGGFFISTDGGRTFVNRSLPTGS